MPEYRIPNFICIGTTESSKSHSIKQDQNKMAGKDIDTAADFTSYYLQQSTKEFAEDLDKIRSAGDFKGDALPMLIHSLQQGTSMFSPADQRRIVDARQQASADDAAAAAAVANKSGDSEGVSRGTRHLIRRRKYRDSREHWLIEAYVMRKPACLLAGIIVLWEMVQVFWGTG
ncbi:hypothetical protein CIB48_g10358 [Xylaria polymorpha]|nr:hypothetical protein CIB48_g10358 [Xylaria polymorpha]